MTEFEPIELLDPRKFVDTPFKKFRRKMRDIKNFFRYDIHQGIERLIIWFPVIWKDRDWDWIYLMLIMRKKIQLMEREERENGHHTTSQYDAKNMRICIDLMNRILEDGPYDHGKHANYGEQAKRTKMHLGWKAVFEYEDAMEDRDIKYLFKVMAKNLRRWWN